MKKIVFIHPDLGIGGAERLILDAYLALAQSQKNDHQLQIITTHHDQYHCFPETLDGSVDVIVCGDWLPRSLFGRFKAACMYLRMLYAALFVVLCISDVKLVICDLVSVCVPIVKWFSSARVIFYCHFPDQLLASHSTVVRRLYRYPIDILECRTTRMADSVLVNSKFTAAVYKDLMGKYGRTPRILYPSVSGQVIAASDGTSPYLVTSLDEPLPTTYFLSINRFERKKNLTLALDTMSYLYREYDCRDTHLVMVGGYDPSNTENIEHYEELRRHHTHTLGARFPLLLLRSPSDAAKFSLLEHCTALIYTPSDEHLGIVPLEAMCFRKPVVAVRSGGPCETVVDGRTGFLREPQPEQFAECLHRLLVEPQLAACMGEAARARVLTHFSFRSFSTQLTQVVDDLLHSCGECSVTTAACD